MTDESFERTGKGDMIEATKPNRGRVVGIDDRLTVPSRIGGGRVDLWIRVEWGERCRRWDALFTSAVGAYLPEGVGRFESLCFTASRGWIVARDVLPATVSVHAVEEQVRALVADVNDRLGRESREMRAAAPQRRRSSRGVLASFFSLLTGLTALAILRR